MATLLKDRGHDALNVGLDWNTEDTVKMLLQWADVILVAEESMLSRIPEEHRPKVDTRFYAGPDQWGVHHHAGLTESFRVFLKEHIPFGPREGQRFFQG